MQLRAVDLTKFVMAMAVVVIHARAVCGINQHDWIHFALGCAVPFFFVTTGFLLARHSIAPDNENRRADQLIAKSRQFFRLYTVWLAVYIPAAIYHYYTNDYTVRDAAVDYLRGVIFYGESPYAWPLWYVFSVAVSLCALALFRRRRWPLWPIVALAIVAALLEWLVYAPFSPATNGHHPTRFLFNAAKLLLWRPFYALGFLLTAAIAYRQRDKLRLLHGILLLALSAALHYLYLPLWQHAAGMAVFVIALRTPLPDHPIWLRLRRLSTGVYFLHMYAIVVLLIAFPGLFTSDNLPAALATTLPLTLLLAAAYTRFKSHRRHN